MTFRMKPVSCIECGQTAVCRGINSVRYETIHGLRGDIIGAVINSIANAVVGHDGHKNLSRANRGSLENSVG